ncbi:MAG: hypothetical protein JW860_07050 [Sedimentisphaerales bacterium]|nr:hypothetical protein [Sedimentisphaerales bacterium]
MERLSELNKNTPDVDESKLKKLNHLIALLLAAAVILSFITSARALAT